jgi:hypothetical protein
MIEYVAMAKANLAWLAWREHRSAEAMSLAEEALNLWHGMEDPYGVDWLALLPAIAVAVEQERLDQAIEYTKGLFGENQHPLPSMLANAANEVIGASETAGASAAMPNLRQLIAVAQQIGYL